MASQRRLALPLAEPRIGLRPVGTALVVLLAGLSIGIAGCGSDRKSGSVTATSTGTVAASGLASTKPGRYREVSDLCPEFDLTPILAVLPHQKGQSKPSEADSSTSHIMKCSAYVSSTADSGDSAFVAIDVWVFKQQPADYAKSQYQRSRDDSSKHLTDVPGLGQGAFAVPFSMAGGLNVETYDGNAFVSIRFSVFSGTVAAEKMTPILVACVRNTLAKLRAGDL